LKVEIPNKVNTNMNIALWSDGTNKGH